MNPDNVPAIGSDQTFIRQAGSLTIMDVYLIFDSDYGERLGRFFATPMARRK